MKNILSALSYGILMLTAAVRGDITLLGEPGGGTTVGNKRSGTASFYHKDSDRINVCFRAGNDPEANVYGEPEAFDVLGLHHFQFATKDGNAMHWSEVFPRCTSEFAPSCIVSAISLANLCINEIDSSKEQTT